MKSPVLPPYGWLELEEVDSTQKAARGCVELGDRVGVVLARRQTNGVGRFGRTWISGVDDSLTMTLIFHEYPNHPRPYLLGMAVAIAAAGAIHCQLQWPNDLVLDDKKVGGILTEMIVRPDGERIALVGVGINLHQSEFPEEIADRATSLEIARGAAAGPMEVARNVIARLASLPEPSAWTDLEPIWMLFDKTPGKRYVLPSGESSIAIAIGGSAQLLCSVEGESRSVMAADAIFGSGA